MTRPLCFAVTIVLAVGLVSSVQAGSFSFTIGGHHIRISASRNCFSAACVSVSIPGIVTTRRKHGDHVAIARDAPSAKPASKARVAPAPVVAPAPQIAPAALPAETRAMVPPASTPFVPRLAVTDSNDVAEPSPPPAEPINAAATEKPAEPAPPIVDISPVEQPAEKPSVALPPTIATPAPDPAPVLKAAEAVDTERDDTPLGDWQTEGETGAVRIEACGRALCGYLINPSSQAKAESILINMKPNGDAEWRGSIFDRISGNTYNAIMTLKSANLLRVEACALGRFFCSGNNWTRIVKQPAALVTSSENQGAPRSWMSAANVRVP